MSGPPSREPTPRAQVAADLERISELLPQAHQLDSEAQKALAKVIDEVAHHVAAEGTATEQLLPLRDSIAHLRWALEHPRDAGSLSAARDRLDQTVMAMETQAPFLAGVLQRLLAALANIGI